MVNSPSVINNNRVCKVMDNRIEPLEYSFITSLTVSFLINCTYYNKKGNLIFDRSDNLRISQLKMI